MKAKPRKPTVGANVQTIWENRQPQFGVKNALNTNNTELISPLGFSSMEREKGGWGWEFSKFSHQLLPNIP